MKSRLSIDIAKSLLMARWRQTLVAAIGVTFSIMMFIALLGFMTGLNIMLDDLFVNRTPHVRLYNEIEQNPNQPIKNVTIYNGYYHFISSVKASNSREQIYNSAAIIHTIQKDKRVLGIAPKITTPAFFTEGSARISGVINGIDVQEENRLFHFYDYITSGSGTDLKVVPNSIVLGKVLAEELLVYIGDLVYVTTSTGEVFPLKLVGLYESGIRDYDKVQGFTSITTAQKILGKPANYVTDIQVKLNDIEQAPGVAKEYSHLFGTQAVDIQTANAEFETGSFIRTLISYVVGITLLIVAGFGIYNILNMMIYEKMDSIAILKATGFSGRDVKKIFLMIAISIGLFGGTVGLFLGYLLSLLIDAVPFKTASLPTIETYPVNYNPLFYCIGIVFSLVTTYLAGLFPAAKASKVDPVIIIRGK
ncbi:FtsX-like permease family protein [Chitinophagaceae bacterium LB-8]|uniref:FtsX-like permease family protein n=1 Tax=Paraflavisolibacter caeni TaxID=2982496 RepID=A0A9X2Y2B5_9BACT|nr:FtsX-like permease family protein [Paraflavisolibacter caeni]MCU7552378.1 FtsX-like permease family protein [Paraflavisolibacter caeni]